jgi:hypothetical protein
MTELIVPDADVQGYCDVTTGECAPAAEVTDPPRPPRPEGGG